MAKDDNSVKVEDLEDIVEDDEAEADEAPKGMRPKDLAAELEIDAKSLRAFLRRTFPRANEAKNTSWYLTDAQVEAARANWAPQDDDEEEVEDEA